MNWQSAFRVAIRIVFLFAFIAFLSASVSHVAVFFNDFEADKSNWIEPYMLAISIDLTALVLTIGVMFFRKEMPWYALIITWIFIVGLTAFSWLTNWEYASTFQGSLLKTNSVLIMLNPILASSFAFFNLVYSFVSEFFGMKQKTADELLAEADRLEALEEAQKRIDAYRQRTRKKSIIQVAKDAAIEAKTAYREVVADSPEADASDVGTSTKVEVADEAQSSTQMEVLDNDEVEVEAEVLEEDFALEDGSDEEVETDPEVEVLNVVPFHQSGSSDFPKISTKEKIARKRLFTIAEAARELECTQRHVRELRKKGTLAADQNGLIVGSSLRSYKANRKAKIS